MSEPQGSTRRRWTQSDVLIGIAPVLTKRAQQTQNTLFVTKLTLSILTHAPGETFIARDQSGFVICSHTDHVGGPSRVTWDFGRGGVELTQASGLRILTGATMTGVVYSEGWDVFTA